jgi:hypothetical protein
VCSRSIGGKIVWFELPVDYSGPPGVSDGTFRFDLIGIPSAEGTAPRRAVAPVPVDLLGIPVALLQKASEEYEALFRELRLMKEHADSAPHPCAGAARAALGPGLGDRHPLQRLRARHGRELAGGGRPQGDPATTGTSNCPSAAACEFYDAMLDEADEFGLVAQLLTLPASATSVAVRRWFLSELISQLHGQAPTRGADSQTTPS